MQSSQSENHHGNALTGQGSKVEGADIPGGLGRAGRQGGQAGRAREDSSTGRKQQPNGKAKVTAGIPHTSEGLSLPALSTRTAGLTISKCHICLRVQGDTAQTGKQSVTPDGIYTACIEI